MKPRLINANALMEYCQNQIDKKIDCNDIARFPTYPTDEWHYVKNGDVPKKSIYVLAYFKGEDVSLVECLYIPDEGFKHPVLSEWYEPTAWIEKEKILLKEIENE